MPFIGTKVNVTIGPEKEQLLKSRFGKAISLLPGKSESWLMLSFEDNCRLYFKGDGAPGIAFVEVKLLGKKERRDYEKLTAELTKILQEELSVDPARVYVNYAETEHWGWNGSNL